VRRHLVQGFWFGLFANGLVLYWMVVALWHFTSLAALGYLATIVILALYSGSVFALAGWVTRRTGLGLLVTFPVFWTAAEWAIGHQGDIGFPWLGLGTSLTGYPTLVQVADLVGARGVTYLLVLANTALALAWRGREQRRSAITLASAVVVGTALVLGYGVIRERGLTLRPVATVALLQPNVGWEEKWEPGERERIVASALALADSAVQARQMDLVVWPEAAVPGYFFQHPTWETTIGDLSRASGVPQVVGGIDIEFEPRREAGADGRAAYEYFNAVFLFDSLGRYRSQPVYRKRYLVPITERVPFLDPRWFDLRFFGGFGRGTEHPVYEITAGTFGVFICYESAFEDLSRIYRARGADFLVNVTNDAWFGRTAAPYQHAAHLVMRAIETRVGIARAANSGISEFVDPLGRELSQTALYERSVVIGQVMTTDSVPLYVRWGDWVGTGVLVLSAVLVLYAVTRRR
jgi:apolipoprotein N-acyltransferase